MKQYVRLFKIYWNRRVRFVFKQELTYDIQKRNSGAITKYLNIVLENETFTFFVNKYIPTCEYINTL